LSKTIIDQDIFLQFKRRNHEAFQYVYDTYHTLCHVIIYSILKHKEWSEDVLQDVFIKVYEKAPTCQSNQTLQAWLALIAHHTALNALAKKKELHWQEGYDDYLLQDESRDVFQTWHRQLSDQENLILAYKLVYDLGFETIARLVNMPLTSVYKQYKQSLDKIKEDYQ
jgi:RNA polymerase sigma factor (sigma-70 family)